MKILSISKKSDKNYLLECEYSDHHLMVDLIVDKNLFRCYEIAYKPIKTGGKTLFLLTDYMRREIINECLKHRLFRIRHAVSPYEMIVIGRVD